jgi:hypothetical protein
LKFSGKYNIENRISRAPEDSAFSRFMSLISKGSRIERRIANLEMLSSSL